jgi:rRNA processing protein Gar1
MLTAEEKLKIKQDSEEREGIKKQVVEANNQIFIGIVTDLFGQINQRYDNHFTVEFNPGIGQIEERSEFQVSGIVYYQPQDEDRVHLGQIDTVLKNFYMYPPKDFVIRNNFSATDSFGNDKGFFPRRKMRKEVGQFIEDCERTFQSVEIQNARYEIDPVYNTKIEDKT